MSQDGKRTLLIIINDSPYGNERPYNALRLGMSLAKQESIRVQVFPDRGRHLLRRCWPEDP